ncbi:MAG: hypothetical protein ACI35S_05465 [Anaeroplasma sp.]
MPEDSKKAPSTIDEARAALKIVQWRDEFYIVCRNPFQEPKLFRITFNEDATYEMFAVYQKSLNCSN